jgi:hypothetical protein
MMMIYAATAHGGLIPTCKKHHTSFSLKIPTKWATVGDSLCSPDMAHSVLSRAHKAGVLIG